MHDSSKTRSGTASRRETRIADEDLIDCKDSPHPAAMAAASGGGRSSAAAAVGGGIDTISALEKILDSDLDKKGKIEEIKLIILNRSDRGDSSSKGTIMGLFRLCNCRHKMEEFSEIIISLGQDLNLKPADIINLLGAIGERTATEPSFFGLYYLENLGIIAMNIPDSYTNHFDIYVRDVVEGQNSVIKQYLDKQNGEGITNRDIIMGGDNEEAKTAIKAYDASAEEVKRIRKEIADKITEMNVKVDDDRRVIGGAGAAPAPAPGSFTVAVLERRGSNAASSERGGRGS